MHAFQIKQESRPATRKMIEPKGGKPEAERKKEIDPRKQNAEERFKDRRQNAAAKRIGEAVQQIVQPAAEQSQKGAEQKRMEMAHLKSACNLPFAPP